MDKILAQILELFKHLTRDLLIYTVSGLLIVVNTLFIDNVYFNDKIWYFLFEISYSPLIILITSYLIGHFVMAVMYLLIELTGLENFLKKKLGLKNHSELLNKELTVFIKNREIYDYFIERYNHLYYLRWGIAGASLTSLIIDLLFLLVAVNYLIVALSVAHFFLFISFLILHYKTGEDYDTRIIEINEVLRNKAKIDNIP